MSEKNRDAKNRWRTVTVAFRLSPEENEELTNRVKMCGCRTRQEYIIQSILHQKVVFRVTEFLSQIQIAALKTTFEIDFKVHQV